MKPGQSPTTAWAERKQEKCSLALTRPHTWASAGDTIRNNSHGWVVVEHVLTWGDVSRLNLLATPLLPAVSLPETREAWARKRSFCWPCLPGQVLLLGCDKGRVDLAGGRWGGFIFVLFFLPSLCSIQWCPPRGTSQWGLWWCSWKRRAAWGFGGGAKCSPGRHSGACLRRGRRLGAVCVRAKSWRGGRSAAAAANQPTDQRGAGAAVALLGRGTCNKWRI